MITGDNALTGCNISYKSKIADFRKKLFIFNYKPHEEQLSCEEFVYEPDMNEVTENNELHKDDSESEREI